MLGKGLQVGSRVAGRLLPLLVALLMSLPAGAIGLCDFQIPTTDVTRLFLTFDYTYLDLPDTSFIDVSSGRFSFSFSHIHDEPDRALSVGSTTVFSIDHLRLDGILGDINLTTRHYVLAEEPVYVFAEVKGDYTSASGRPGLELRIGSGYGRLTDVTALVRAVRIDERLREDLVISAPLSDPALQEIARLIGRETEFTGIAELVSRIEDVVVSETGAVLSTRSLLTIAEQIRATEVSQQCGWATQLGLGYELLRRFGESRQLLLTLSSDLVRPISLESHIEAHADLSRPLFEAASAFSFSVRYGHRLSETTRLVAEYALQGVRHAGQDPVLGETIEAEILFDLGPVSLTVSGSLSRGTGMAGWVESVVIAARVDLI